LKQISESFCTACEWHGDGKGLTGCPICGQPVTTLDLDAETSSQDTEEYPEEMIKEARDEDEFDENLQ